MVYSMISFLSTNMKKGILFMFIALGFLVIPAFSVDVDEYLNGESPYDSMEAGWWAESVDLWKELQDIAVWEEWVLKKLLTSLWFDFDGTNVAVQFISNIINFFLVTIGLVSLAILIFWFYRMLVSSDQTWMEQARKLILNTVIAIAIIGMARFITNFLFDLFYISSEGI